ncbi:MAG: xanthine dehydrogenase family protein molybdopterin-binding subunit, partial [Acetobacteraceae bacterium]|nr:xanthine dehydrogenase family protein molybdopterin-binding subunit [Acetobacteraceae bacterium]
MTDARPYIGTSVRRVDGPAKVTGAAKYAAEFSTPDLAHGYVVSSAIAKGRINRIDTSAALAVPGVVQVFTHENRPPTALLDRAYRDDIAPPGSPLRPLHDSKILFSGQPVALVVAERFGIARYAASLVRVEYEPAEHVTHLDRAREGAYEPKEKRSGVSPPPSPRGDAHAAFAQAAIKIA